MDKKVTEKELKILESHLIERIEIIDARSMDHNLRILDLQDRLLKLERHKPTLLEKTIKWFT